MLVDDAVTTLTSFTPALPYDVATEQLEVSHAQN